jgi:predicted PurR-regulated permease PerM
VAAVIMYTVIQQLENNLLVPKIQGDAVELHPSAVMLALVVGGAIAGLLGAILALPITAAARDVFRYIFHRVDDPPSTPAEALAFIRAHPTTVVTPEPDPPDGVAAEA